VPAPGPAPVGTRGRARGRIAVRRAAGTAREARSCGTGARYVRPVTEPSAPAPGWYPDPADPGSGGLRWWTGSAWTDDTVDHPWSSASTEATPPPAIPVVTSAPPAAVVPDAFAPVVRVPPPGATTYPEPVDSGPAPRGRGPAVWLVVVALVVVLVAGIGAAVLLGRTGGRSQLDMATVESEIATRLSNRTGISTTVDCPDSVAIEAGTTFTCTATSADGSTATVVVHQDDDQGNLTFGIPR
jgi:hypothetical protein